MDVFLLLFVCFLILSKDTKLICRVFLTHSLPLTLCIYSVNKMETNFVYCLLCKKPQNCIQTHLRKVCLKDCTPQEREEEASRAIDSQKLFGNEGRVWNFTELQEYCKDEEACIKLCTRLQSRGFLITNSPQACPTVVPTARYDDLIATSTYWMTHTHFQ